MIEKLEVLMNWGNRGNFRYVMRISEKMEEKSNIAIWGKRAKFLGRNTD